MDEKNKVTVIVYGQEYTLSGDMPREYIMKIADHVDAKMKEVGEGTNQPTSAVAVLAAMLAADEYYKLEEEKAALLSKNLQLAENGRNYERMWEELKQSYAQYKDEMSTLGTLKDNLQAYANEKESQANALAAELSQQQKYNNELRNRIEELNAQLEVSVQRVNDAPLEAQKHIEELENRCRDIESSFFDIQMENIHLKNEIETLRGRR